MWGSLRLAPISPNTEPYYWVWPCIGTTAVPLYLVHCTLPSQQYGQCGQTIWIFTVTHDLNTCTQKYPIRCTFSEYTYPPTPQTSQHVCIALPAQPLSLCTKPPFTVSGACQKQLGRPDCIICVQTVPLLIGVHKIKSLTTTLNVCTVCLVGTLLRHNVATYIHNYNH